MTHSLRGRPRHTMTYGAAVVVNTRANPSLIIGAHRSAAQRSGFALLWRSLSSALLCREKGEPRLWAGGSLSTHAGPTGRPGSAEL